MSYWTTPLLQQCVSWVAGPSLTLHTKPWQDVMFKARCPCDSFKLSPLLFHAEHDFSGSSGSRIHLTMLRTATSFQCCLKQEKCLVYEWFFCKNKNVHLPQTFTKLLLNKFLYHFCCACFLYAMNSLILLIIIAEYYDGLPKVETNITNY